MRRQDDIKKDQAYEDVLKKYITMMIEQKKAEYRSDVEPFEIHAEKMKGDLEDYFHHFHECFLNGYEVLIKQLKKK